MKAPATPIARAPLKEALTALFADPRDKAFFFELDGVLFADRRTGAADPPADVPIDLLAELERLAGGAVAVLSKAPLDDVDRILAPLRLAGCGLSGLEIRRDRDGPATRRRFAADLDPVRRLLERRPSLEAQVGVIDEDLALAFRHDGDPAGLEAAKSFARDAVALAPAAFRADFGSVAIRVTFAGASVGGAICQIMETAAFAGRTPVVFGPAGEGNDHLAVAHVYGGTTVTVGRAVAGHTADIVLEGPRDVQWVVRDFIAHFGAECRASFEDDVPLHGDAAGSRWR